MATLFRIPHTSESTQRLCLWAWFISLTIVIPTHHHAYRHEWQDLSSPTYMFSCLPFPAQQCMWEWRCLFRMPTSVLDGFFLDSRDHVLLLFWAFPRDLQSVSHNGCMNLHSLHARDPWVFLSLPSPVSCTLSYAFYSRCVNVSLSPMSCLCSLSCRMCLAEISSHSFCLSGDGFIPPPFRKDSLDWVRYFGQVVFSPSVSGNLMLLSLVHQDTSWLFPSLTHLGELHCYLFRTWH